MLGLGSLSRTPPAPSPLGAGRRKMAPKSRSVAQGSGRSAKDTQTVMKKGGYPARQTPPHPKASLCSPAALGGRAPVYPVPHQHRCHSTDRVRSSSEKTKTQPKEARCRVTPPSASSQSLQPTTSPLPAPRVREPPRPPAPNSPPHIAPRLPPHPLPNKPRV